jgi:hypothetical protein
MQRERNLLITLRVCLVSWLNWSEARLDLSPASQQGLFGWFAQLAWFL